MKEKIDEPKVWRVDPKTREIYEAPLSEISLGFRGLMMPPFEHGKYDSGSFLYFQERADAESEIKGWMPQEKVEILDRYLEQCHLYRTADGSIVFRNPEGKSLEVVIQELQKDFDKLFEEKK